MLPTNIWQNKQTDVVFEAFLCFKNDPEAQHLKTTPQTTSHHFMGWNLGRASLVDFSSSHGIDWDPSVLFSANSEAELGTPRCFTHMHGALVGMAERLGSALSR